MSFRARRPRGSTSGAVRTRPPRSATRAGRSSACPRRPCRDTSRGSSGRPPPIEPPRGDSPGPACLPCDPGIRGIRAHRRRPQRGRRRARPRAPTGLVHVVLRKAAGSALGDVPPSRGSIPHVESAAVGLNSTSIRVIQRGGTNIGRRGLALRNRHLTSDRPRSLSWRCLSRTPRHSSRSSRS